VDATMFEYILWDLIRFAFPFAVGVVSLIFYAKKKLSGMLVIAVAFFLNAIVTDILFGSTLHLYLFDSGLGAYAYGYLAIFGFVFEITFTILIVIGLFTLYRQMRK
jgi:hypothetical protein